MKRKNQFENFYVLFSGTMKMYCASPALWFVCQKCYMFYCVRKQKLEYIVIMEGYLFAETSPDLKDHKDLV